MIRASIENFYKNFEGCGESKKKKSIHCIGRGGNADQAYIVTSLLLEKKVYSRPDSIPSSRKR